MAASLNAKVDKHPDNMHFVCQKCHQPLRFNPSFETGIDKQLINELGIPLSISSTESESNSDKGDGLVFSNTDEETGIEAGVDPALMQAASTDKHDEHGAKKLHTLRNIPPLRLISSDSGNGYAMVEKAKNSQPSLAELRSHKLQVAAELFDILSECSEVDHPLCEDCTDRLLDEMDAHLRMIEDECKEYTDFLGEIQSTPALQCKEDAHNLQERISQLHIEAKTLEKNIVDNEKEEKIILKQIAAERDKLKKVQEEEKALLKEYSDCKKQLFDFEDNQRSVDNQLKYAQAQLDKLKKTNIFNATFHIWHSGQFGTINNFRLGRLPNVPVDWHEINAAWGQTVLLLHSLAKKMSLEFERYRLVPYGNNSYVECLADKTKELPLYGSGGIRFFWDTKFDQAMVAFLDCLQQFKEEVERGDSNFCLPYRMEKGKIEDPLSNTSYSIKIQFNSEEQWTKALKFMLTNLKWGLAWVSSQFANK